MTSVGNFTPTYDSNGNVTNDSLHTYTWDSDGNSVTVDSVGLTFDALDRMVEQNRSGVYTQIVYAPTGAKLALMNGQSLVKAFIPLPGQATAVYTSSGLDHYRHSDWLGSARLTSSPTQSYASSVAYAPLGETYAQSGTADFSFTGQNSDTTSGDYDFLFREYSMQGRWASPDPAGLAAVDPTNPQSWNRYAYVRNAPLTLIDPFGLCTFEYNSDLDGFVLTCDPIDGNGSAGGGGGGGGSGCRTTYFLPLDPDSLASGDDADADPQSGPGCGGGGSGQHAGGNSSGGQTPAEAATQYCRDNGHILNFKVPFTNITVTLDATATAGPIKYGTTNDIQTVIPLMPWGPPVGAGVGYTLKINAPKDPAPQLSYGIQNGLSAGVFIKPDGTHQGSVFSFGLGIGPLYTLVLPTNNACGMMANKKN